MLKQMRSSRTGSIALLLIASVALAACAKKPKENANLNPSSTTVAKPGSLQDFVVNVGDRVLFQTDSSSITGEGRSILDRQAQWLSRYGQYTFTIEGHADERGTREYNLALGARRATAVKRYLTSKGIASSRMRSISLGKERPVAVCNDISCWSQNRRGVTVLAGGNS